MIRHGMWGPGFAMPGDPPGAITLSDIVLWHRFSRLVEKCVVGNGEVPGPKSL
jgi:hypothetical protein